MDTYTGEIRLLPYMFVPQNWALCNGALLPATQYQSLFSVIGYTYGGDQTKGQFALPNLQKTLPDAAPTAGSIGCAVIGMGTGSGLTARVLGSRVGESQVVLSGNQMPAHNHRLRTLSNSTAADASKLVGTPEKNWLAHGEVTSPTLAGFKSYAPKDGNMTPLDGTSIVPNGGNAVAHDNHQPYLAMNFCICLFGEYFPDRP